MGDYEETEHHHDGHDDPDFDEQAYEDDLAAQNAVEDAKYDYPPQEEPPDGYYDTPTHHELAEDLLMRSDTEDDPAWAQARATQAVARAVLAVADPLAAFAGIEQRLGELRVQLADHLRATERSWERVDAALAALAASRSEPDVTDVVGVGSVSPTDPAALGEWLRGLPHRTILSDRFGDPCLRELGTELEFQTTRAFPALFILGDAFEISEDRANNVDDLARYAPFTVLALGKTAQDGGEPST